MRMMPLRTTTTLALMVGALVLAAGSSSQRVTPATTPKVEDGRPSPRELRDRQPSAVTTDLLRRLKGKLVVVKTRNGHRGQARLVGFAGDEITLEMPTGKTVVVRRSLITTIAKASRTWRDLRRERLTRAAASDEKTAGMSLGFGVPLLVLGSIGTAGAVGLAVSAAKRSDGTRNLRGIGALVLGMLSALPLIPGIALTVEGSKALSRYRRALERVTPTLEIDPAQKRYAVSLGYRF